MISAPQFVILRGHPGRRFPSAARPSIAWFTWGWLAVVTPGQQAPLGHTLSLERRLLLLDWAAANNAWVVEDDYLSELQLTGRAAPALASLDRAGCVIRIGSFSKTISPALRLGFVIAPPALVPLFAETAACLMPAPGPAVQMAVAEFIREGHYLRHIRRMKRLYASRQQAVLACLPSSDSVVEVTTPGLAVLLKLRNHISDVAKPRHPNALVIGFALVGGVLTTKSAVTLAGGVVFENNVDSLVLRPLRLKMRRFIALRVSVALSR